MPCRSICGLCQASARGGHDPSLQEVTAGRPSVWPDDFLNVPPPVSLGRVISLGVLHVNPARRLPQGSQGPLASDLSFASQGSQARVASRVVWMCSDGVTERTSIRWAGMRCRGHGRSTCGPVKMVPPTLSVGVESLASVCTLALRLPRRACT